MKVYFILFFTVILFFSIQAQEHGFIGGLSLTGFNKVSPPYGGSAILNYDFQSYENNFHLGYQYRQLIASKYMIDFYGLIGSRTNTLRNDAITSVMNSSGIWVSYQDSTTYSLKYHYLSVGVIASWKIWKQLHVGAGLEPTFYYSAAYPINKTSNFVFDVPLVLRLGYSFKYFDLSASFKKGNLSLVKDANFRSLKTTDFQFSVFVPISNFLPKK